VAEREASATTAVVVAAWEAVGIATEVNQAAAEADAVGMAVGQEHVGGLVDEDVMSS
jgi:hypothetical protein